MENNPRVRYGPSETFNQHKVLCQKDNNSSITSQEMNQKINLPQKKYEFQGVNHNSQRYTNSLENNKENINENNQNNMQVQQTEMDIEIGPQSNELIDSGATNYSNNIHSSIESNNKKIVQNDNILFYPEKKNNINTNIQNQNQPNKVENINNKQNVPNSGFLFQDNNKNQIFNYNFESNEELLSFVGEYLNEIYKNLLSDEKELKYKPRIGYMDLQNDINEQMRAILIDWLIEVHYRFKLKNETLFQTVWIIDTYLSYQQITRAKLQLLGIASLLISCKSQEIYYPQLKEFIDITDGAYIKSELLEMENNILKILNFNILSPTSNDFYNIIAKAFNFGEKEYFFGKYFLESSLIDYRMIRFPSSVIAVSCAYIVMKFFGIDNYKMLYSNDVVKEECPQKIIKEAAREVYILVKNLSQSTLKAVKDKYTLSQFLNVAQYSEQQ